MLKQPSLRRYIRFVLFFCLLLLIFTSLAVAQDSGLSTALSSGARFRSGPGTDWRLLGNLPAGTPIVIDGKAPGGGWVRGIIPDGRVGWVVDSSIAAAPEQIEALPGVWVDTPFTLTAPPAPAGAPVESADPVEAPDQTVPIVSVALPEGGLTAEVGSRVRLRANPDSGAAVYQTLEPGLTVSLDGRDPTQQWVRAAVPGGSKGWVAARFLVVTGAQVAALPVVEGGSVQVQSGPAQSAASAPADGSPGAAVAPVLSTAPVRGFSYGGHVDGFGENAVSAMRLAGMTWAKKQWRYFAGQNPADVSGIINDAHAKGFRILIGIVGLPGELNNPGYFEQYAAFVGGVAAQGADAIEIWNEMNIDREWPAGSINPGRYVDLLRLSYNAIKSANPNTLVISGAPAPTGFFGGCGSGGCDDNAYIAGMASAGAASYADCIGLHYNEGIVGPNQTSGDPRGNSTFYSRYFWGMINTYNSAFRGARPLCFTELGYLTPQGYPPLPGGFAWAQDVTVGQQAAWLDQAVNLSRSSGKVRLLIVWNVDFTSYGDDPMGGYAIIRPDGSCPACEALAR